MGVDPIFILLESVPFEQLLALCCHDRRIGSRARAIFSGQNHTDFQYVYAGAVVTVQTQVRVLKDPRLPGPGGGGGSVYNYSSGVGLLIIDLACHAHARHIRSKDTPIWTPSAVCKLLKFPLRLNELKPGTNQVNMYSHEMSESPQRWRRGLEHLNLRPPNESYLPVTILKIHLTRSSLNEVPQVSTLYYLPHCIITNFGPKSVLKPPLGALGTFVPLRGTFVTPCTTTQQPIAATDKHDYI